MPARLSACEPRIVPRYLLLPGRRIGGRAGGRPLPFARLVRLPFGAGRRGLCLLLPFLLAFPVALLFAFVVTFLGMAGGALRRARLRDLQILAVFPEIAGRAELPLQNH